VVWLTTSRRALRIVVFELGQLQPAQKGVGADFGYPRGLFDVPLCEQSGDRFFLLPPNFSAMPSHHLPPSDNQPSCIARRSPGLILLAFLGIQSDRCCHAVITAQGENMKSTTEQTETAPAAATTETKATKKAAAGARRANVAPAKSKAGKKATSKKKAPRSARNDALEGSKTATIVEMLKRPDGATAKELLKATGWQPHSLRGFQEDGLDRHVHQRR
jgi:hypothetical protein